METSVEAASVSFHARSLNKRWAVPMRVLAFGAATTGFAFYESLRLFALTNNDVWWRLQTGLWILKNHAIPRDGLFSQSASLPWIDASWLFEALTGFFYRQRGLAGLPSLLACLQVMVALSLFGLAFRVGRRFWPAIALCAVAQFSLMPLQPSPTLLSIAFLAIELNILIRARSEGNVRVMYWLPAVFVAWANCDRQFFYGLLLLALFLASVMLDQLLHQPSAPHLRDAVRGLRPAAVALVAGISSLATLFSPYGWRLYVPVWNDATSSAVDRYFSDLHSLRFRQPQDYALMLLTMAAFFALGRQRWRDLFLTSVLILSAVLSFRFASDSWMVVVSSVAVISNALAEKPALSSPRKQPLWGRTEILSAAGLVALLTVAVLMDIPARNDSHRDDRLAAKVEEKFPVKAADFIQKNRLPAPIFNICDWGGFLTFALPEYQVSIDGRTDLYGEDLDLAYFKLMQAQVPLQSDPTFARAQTIILEANSPIAKALGTMPDFRQEYRDDLAVVFVRESALPN